MSASLPRMYDEIAEWFHLLTAPADYAAEWKVFRAAIWSALGRPPRDLLELGSGGGNLALHYARDIPLCVLSDLSPQMLKLSRGINPHCEHVEGDMRSLRLGRRFDVVLVHDAVMYMTSEADLARAMETAAAHCRPGGVTIFIPDFTRETFKPDIDCGGHDGPARALRYLEWVHDPDPADTTVSVDYAYVLHENGKPPRTLGDCHTVGVFGEATWLSLLRRAGFEPETCPGAGDGSTAEIFFIGRAKGP